VSLKKRTRAIRKSQLRVSGQFMMTLGTFLAVVASFLLVVLIVGASARLIFMIMLFFLFFIFLFIPISIAIRPMIDRDVIHKYLDEIEEQVRRWNFREKDLYDLKMLRQHLQGKDNKGYVELFQRVVFVLSEMEKIERARADFYWHEPPEGPLH
jgi:hypothetical protein